MRRRRSASAAMSRIQRALLGTSTADGMSALLCAAVMLAIRREIPLEDLIEYIRTAYGSFPWESEDPTA